MSEDFKWTVERIIDLLGMLFVVLAFLKAVDSAITANKTLQENRRANELGLIKNREDAVEQITNAYKLVVECQLPSQGRAFDIQPLLKEAMEFGHLSYLFPGEFEWFRDKSSLLVRHAQQQWIIHNIKARMEDTSR